MARVTDAYLKRAIPEDGKKILSIRLETNLSCQIRITPKGSVTRSFVFRSVLQNGKAITEYLGSVSDLTIAEARLMAQERRELLKQGVKPKEFIQNTLNARLAKQQREEQTMQTVLEYYLSKRKNLSRNTQIKDQTSVNAIKPFLDVTISQLDSTQIPYELINDCISKGYITKARVVAALIIQLCETAIDYNLIDHNPFLRLPRIIPTRKVTHFASVSPDNIQEDLTAIFKAVFKDNKLTKLNSFFLLSMFTLLRPMEVANLKKKNWNQENGTLFVEQTKTMREGWTVQTNPLLDSLLSNFLTLNSGENFLKGSPRTSVTRFNDFCRDNKLHFTAHGCRSAGMSWLVQNGTPIHVANILLTHKIGDTVTLTYMRSDLPEERKEALLKWNKYLEGILKSVCPDVWAQIFNNVN